jgi:hypothetical protein
MTEMCREMLESKNIQTSSENSVLFPNHLNMSDNRKSWLTDAFLERVILKVRRRESEEMASRIIDEISLPTLRLLAKTRLSYRPTPTTSEVHSIVILFI